VTLDKKFGKAHVTLQQEETVYEGFFRIKKLFLQHALFRGGQSPVIRRELFCRGESVGILLYDPLGDRVGLVRQFRVGCLENREGPWVWEVIAGVSDKGESLEAVATREVHEESGLVVEPAHLVPIHRYYSSPGGSDERLQLFCALLPLKEEERIGGLAQESEDILFKTFGYREAIDAMLAGRINNAATLIALQWLQLNRHGIQEKFCGTTSS